MISEETAEEAERLVKVQTSVLEILELYFEVNINSNSRPIGLKTMTAFSFPSPTDSHRSSISRAGGATRARGRAKRHRRPFRSQQSKGPDRTRSRVGDPPPPS